MGSKAYKGVRTLLCATLAALSLISRADELVCPSTQATVAYPGDDFRETASIACDAITRTLGFMAASGFDTRNALRVEIVDELSTRDQGHPLGTYDNGSDAIRLLSWESFCQACSDNPLFGMPPNLDLYQSVIAHEAAHAIASGNFRIEKPSRTAHEYIAYVVQLSTMPADLRQLIIEQSSVSGFNDASEISSVYLAMNPEAFAVKCYLHYRDPENGNEFLHKLLGGEVRLDGDLDLY